MVRSPDTGPAAGPQDPLFHLDDPDVVVSRVGAALSRCTEALAAAPPTRRAVGHWTVGDLAGHLTDMVEIYSRLMEGGGHPAGRLENLGNHNERSASGFDGTPAQAAKRMRSGAARMLTLIKDGWNQQVPWLSDIVLSGRSVALLALGEFLVHGHDAAGSGWTIDPLDASILLAGIEPLAVHYVNEEEAAGLRVSIETRIRGGVRRRFVFDGPRLSIVEPEGRRGADCYISGDPTTFVLLMYGRGGPIGAALTGKVVAWGRKPWLALKLPKLIRNP